MIFIVDHIHHLMNESKMLMFAYNSNRGCIRVGILKVKFNFDLII